MRPELLHFASDLANRGEPFALATVVRREPPSSAHVGDTALVTHSRAFHGWVGGTAAISSGMESTSQPSVYLNS